MNPDGPRPPGPATALLRLLLPDALEGVVLGDLEEEYRERREEGRPLRADAWYWSRILTIRPLRLRRALRTVARAWHADPWSFIRSLKDRPMESLARNLRHTVRRLARSPVFTVAAVLSLALGIGGNTAVFSLTNAVFLRDRGIAEPERVIQVFRNSGGPYWRVTWEDYRRMRDETEGVFTRRTAYREAAFRLGDSDDVTPGLRISGDYFGVMGVEPALGRPFVPGEDTDVEHRTGVAVISHDLWQGAFGGDPGIVGREIRVNARPTTVVGVLPEDFTAKATGLAMDLFVPDPGAVRNPGSDNLWMGARLAPGVTVERARSALGRIAAAYNRNRPESRRPVAFTVVSEADVSVHPALDEAMIPMVVLLFGVVGTVLLIACTNLASFLLARAAERRKEFAVRKALGAGREGIVRQLLGESLMLGLLGGGVGMLVAYGALDLLLGVQPPIPVDVSLDVSPDWRVFAFTLGVSLLAGLVFGLFPALKAARSDVAPTLRDESGASTGGRRKWTVRGVLVAGQVTLSLVLLMAAGLFLRSLLQAAGVDPGFDPEGVAIATVDPGTTGYDEAEARRLYDRLLDRTRALPDVRAAGLGTRIPLQLGEWRTGVQRPDVEPPPGREWRYLQLVLVSPGYFEALGIEVRRGRGFAETDGAVAPPVVILNREAVRALWEEGAEVVGQPLELSWRDESGRVVGIVEDTKVKTLGQEPEAMIYVPIAQRHRGSAILVARGDGDPGALAARLRTTAKELDPDLYVHSAMSATESTSTALFLPRMAGIVLGVFGGLALLMAAIGLYGIVSYTVASREREVGIRLSLGARADEVVRLMMGRGLRLVGVGLVAGTVLAVLAGTALERFLFGVAGTDPVTLITVPLVLLAVAAVAAWAPARRASRVDPMETLRSP